MLATALAAFLCAPPAAAAPVDAERVQAADRLADRAQRALDALLGPGRSQVHVEVQGERTELTSESEILRPLGKASSAAAREMRLVELPGYVKDGNLPPQPAPAKPGAQAPAAAAPAVFQKEHDVSLRESGFQIRSVQATVLLDSSLPDGAVRDAGQLLPQVLRLDTSRGDALSLLRAPLRPAWKSAFATPSDWRAAALAAAGALTLLLAALIAGRGFVGAGRALGRELASRARAEPVPADAASAEPIPELAPGSAGLLMAAAGPREDVPLIGRRFDFLSGADAGSIARALEREKPEDLALFFGHLSESIPDLASRLFARLPSSAQAEASEALIKMSLGDPDRLSAVEERLRDAVENGVQGPQSLGRILSRVPGEARADLLGRLAVRDARGVEEVERHLFAFEDLAALEPEPLLRLIRAAPADAWGPALRGAPAGLVERVLAALPPGVRERARAAAATPQEREKVAQERSRILDALGALRASGEVSLGGPGAGDLV